MVLGVVAQDRETEIDEPRVGFDRDHDGIRQLHDACLRRVLVREQWNMQKLAVRANARDQSCSARAEQAHDKSAVIACAVRIDAAAAIAKADRCLRQDPRKSSSVVRTVDNGDRNGHWSRGGARP
jgi:hypothetical protein